MPWVRLDDQFPHHPKVIGVGPLGLALQVAGLCYSSQYLTDGFIPASAVATLLDFSELDEHAFNGVGGTCWYAVEKLVDAGVWEQIEGGYQIHDYLDYQPSRAAILKDRADAKERMTRLRSPDVRANNGRSSEEVHDTRTHTRTQGSNEPLEKPPVSPFSGGTLSPALEKLIPPGEPKPEPQPDGNSQGKKPTKAAKTTPRAAPTITSQEREKLVEKWAGTFGLDGVGERIAEALDHEAARKRGKSGSWYAYVNGWLRDDSTKGAARLGPAAVRSGAAQLLPVNGHGPPGLMVVPATDELTQEQIDRDREVVEAWKRAAGKG